MAIDMIQQAQVGRFGEGETKGGEMESRSFNRIPRQVHLHQATNTTNTSPHMAVPVPSSAPLTIMNQTLPSLESRRILSIHPPQASTSVRLNDPYPPILPPSASTSSRIASTSTPIVSLAGSRYMPTKTPNVLGSTSDDGPQTFSSWYRQSGLEREGQSRSTPRSEGQPKPTNSFHRVIPSVGSSIKQRGRPRKMNQDSRAPSPFPKKRGRPFSTTDGAGRAAAKAAREDARPDRAEAPKKRGRPFKILEHTIVPPQDPEYVIFKCEWKGCDAELVNLETLGKHVMNVHTRNGSKLYCQWLKCQAPWLLEDENELQHGHRPGFESLEELRDHLDYVHLEAVAWHLGDGPKLPLMADGPRPGPGEPWLYDDDGKQVTPSIKDQGIEHGVAARNNKRRFVKRRDSYGEAYLEPVKSDAYGKVLETTEDSNARQLESRGNSGVAVVLKSVPNPEMYQKVVDEDEDEDDTPVSDMETN